MRKRVIIFIIILFIIICSIMIFNDMKKIKINNEEKNIVDNNKSVELYEEKKVVLNKTNIQNNTNTEIKKKKKEINDWRLILVNSENKIPDDYNINLVNIDDEKQVDERIVAELFQMLQDIKSAGIDDVWVQSAYRSTEYQEEVYNNRIERFIKDGLSPEEAEIMTSKVINKPGTSEHNLGLCIDLNYVNYDFENSEAFNWLKINAEKYGFILRYPKEKEEITKISYEPWHWRYVGVEHAKKMNELNMCLEEYIEYLSTNY